MWNTIKNEKFIKMLDPTDQNMYDSWLKLQFLYSVMASYFLYEKNLPLNPSYLDTMMFVIHRNKLLSKGD